MFKKRNIFYRHILLRRNSPIRNLSLIRKTSSPFYLSQHNFRMFRKKRLQRFQKTQEQKQLSNFNPQYEFDKMSWGEVPTQSISSFSDVTFWPKEMGPVLVVSIRENRMHNFTERMGPWMKHMRRFPATDGRLIDTKRWFASGKVIDRRMTAGRMGCYDSHVRIWETIANSPHEVVTVLEDDVDWSIENASSILANLKESFQELHGVHWDFLCWGHGPWAFHKNKTSGLQHWRIPGTCQGFFAYTLTRDFARSLVQSCRPYKASAVDKWFFDIFIKSQSCVVLCSEPRLCWVVEVESDTMKKKLIR